MVEEKLETGLVRLEASDWRWSASIVGLVKYFDSQILDYKITDDYLEFDSANIDKQKYFKFAEENFKKDMHHKIIENMLESEEYTEADIKTINEKLSANTVMKKVFKGIKFDGENSKQILDEINKNRQEIIEKTFKGGRALYYNFCNENNMFSEKGKSCRIRGYSIDMGKKSKSVSFMRDKNTFVYQDSQFFDFIPFAFSKTREAFFINNNFTIDQLIKTNKDDIWDNEKTGRSQLFFKMQNSATFIDYDVEVIKKEREKDYFETIFLRKEAIKIFEKIDENTVKALARPCNIKRSDKSENVWFPVEREVVKNILNLIKLDDIIDKLLKAYNNHSYLIYNLIKINYEIYLFLYKGEKMNEKQRLTMKAAQETRNMLKVKGKENKIRTYEQRLISSLSLRDYAKVQEILLHLSAFTQVKMDFLIDVFEDFEKNKNLVYTFINTLGEKKAVNEKKGENK